MELKDVILSTLAEINDVADLEISSQNSLDAINQNNKNNEVKIVESEQRFLQTMQERLLVLFEGFQAPNNNKIEAKVDLTLNFLEYLLSMIENRLIQMEQKRNK